MHNHNPTLCIVSEEEIKKSIALFLKILTQFFNFYSLLLHRIPLSNRHGSKIWRTFIYSFWINRNTVRSSDFILPSISFSNSTSIIILTFKSLAQVTENLFSSSNLFFIFFDQREDGKLNWS